LSIYHNDLNKTQIQKVAIHVYVWHSHTLCYHEFKVDNATATMLKCGWVGIVYTKFLPISYFIRAHIYYIL